jgi:trimeric autotransporter adhesin
MSPENCFSGLCAYFTTPSNAKFAFMRKLNSLAIACLLLIIAGCSHINTTNDPEAIARDKYDGAKEAQLFEIERTKDPALGIVPSDRLWIALDYTQNLKTNYQNKGLSLLWTERGPVYDSVGPSNGNGRGGGTGVTGAYTSGRIMAFMVDLSDPTGNTVFCGGVAGGVWKCTNFLSAAPNWACVNDYFSNMAIASMCQDLSNPDIMYFATGEPYGNSDAVLGNGIWKSTDHGATWNRLLSTATYTRSFKILCDNSGNVYAALRGAGLKRSNDGGSSWASITPSGISATASCTDIELSSTGTLHASFGFGSSVAYRYTTSPASASSAGWNSGSGLFSTTPSRFELTVTGNTVYGITTNANDDIDFTYKSVDGGSTWTKQNVSAYTSFTSGQGWYDVTLSVNPDDPTEIMMGELDAYRSSNSGATISRATFWIGAGVYVHADHHLMEWTKVGAESRIIIACDGGLYFSNDGGSSFADKNLNLSLKQFYSCDIHPTLTDNIYGGTQDNGCHIIKKPGLTYSIESSGGDGAYVHIDKLTPQYYFGSYIRNQFKRSSNGGTNFSNFYFSTNGLFINPWVYDDNLKIIYSCNGTSGVPNQVFRWSNPTTATSTATSVTATFALSVTGYPSAFLLSPYTLNRLYVGTSAGDIERIDNAATVTSADIIFNETYLGASSGYVSCIAMGTNENHLIATRSSYGVNQVRYSSDGGTNWTTIDGNLPDMPVRWAVFHPTDNTKAIIATEAGVYTTGLINGSSTLWYPSPGFPLVRTDMLKVRTSDNTIVAATHGRGMYTANILSVLPLRKITLQGRTENDNTASLNWGSIGATDKTKYYLEYSSDGVNFKDIGSVAYPINKYKHTFTTPVGYYRIMGIEPNAAPVYSNIIVLKSAGPVKNLFASVNPNPLTGKGNITVSSPVSGDYSWQIMNIQGKLLKNGSGNFSSAGNANFPVEMNHYPAGMYYLLVIQGNNRITSAFIKQ